MLNTIGNGLHKLAVVGLVGLTVSGGCTIGAGLLELRERRNAYEAAQGTPAAAGTTPAAPAARNTR